MRGSLEGQVADGRQRTLVNSRKELEKGQEIYFLRPVITTLTSIIRFFSLRNCHERSKAFGGCTEFVNQYQATQPQMYSFFLHIFRAQLRGQLQEKRSKKSVPSSAFCTIQLMPWLLRCPPTTTTAGSSIYPFEQKSLLRQVKDGMHEMTTGQERVTKL